MPSHFHEVLVKMVQDQPRLVADLLAGPLGIGVPAFESAQLSAGDLGDIAPTEYRADAVVTLNVADRPVFAVVVEVQLHVAVRKRYVWPAYVATLYARLRCPVILLVLCPDPAVASWCAEPIVVFNPGLRLTPTVLGPQQMPVVTDIAVARRHPELTVLSALAHGDAQDSSMFTALFAALDVIDLDSANLYIDLVLMVLPAAAQVWLEEFMTTTPFRYQSDFARRYFGQGEAKGKAEGKAEGEARALLAILDARNIPVPDDVRADITACTDLDQLDAWVRRAATAVKIEDVLD
jgi:hypothetical protein